MYAFWFEKNKESQVNAFPQSPATIPKVSELFTMSVTLLNDNNGNRLVNFCFRISSVKEVFYSTGKILCFSEAQQSRISKP